MSISYEIVGKVAVLSTESMYSRGDISDALTMAMEENAEVSTLIFDETEATYRPNTEEILDTIHASCDFYPQIQKISMVISRSVQGDIGRTIEIVEDSYGESFSIFMDRDEAWLDIEEYSRQD